MINIFNNVKVYRDIYRLFYNISQRDDKISNVHSIDLDDLEVKYLNIVFDYVNEIRVSISIAYDSKIDIVAPDNVKNYVKSVISEQYPDYTSLLD